MGIREIMAEITRAIITYFVLFMITIGYRLFEFQESNSNIHKSDVADIYLGSIIIAFLELIAVLLFGVFIFG